ncbi:MAG: CoA-transferase [Dehalococcoidia bacterium]
MPAGRDPAPRLDPTVMAMVVVREFFDGAVVNLGIGIPMHCADAIPPDMDVLLHSEHGLLGFGPMLRDPADVDPYVFIVGNRPVEPRPGMVFLSHDESFALIRGGHIDVTVMGGMRVDAEGNLANAHAPGKPAANLGGAPDLATCARRTIIMMFHTTADGAQKILERCTLPLTAPRCVNRIVTDVAVMDLVGGRIVLREVAPGWSPADVQAITRARLVVADDVREIALG